MHTAKDANHWEVIAGFPICDVHLCQKVEEILHDPLLLQQRARGILPLDDVHVPHKQADLGTLRSDAV